MDEYSEVSVLIKAASEAACQSKRCYIDDPESRSFCVGCGLPVRYIPDKPYLTISVGLMKAIGAWSIFLLNILDVVSTYAALGVGAQEANPIARALMDSYVWIVPIAIPIKLVFSCILLWTFTRRIDKATDLLMCCAVWAMSGIYSYVVLNNFFLFFQGL